MISQGSGNPNDQPLADRQWGSGFLPTRVSGREVPLAAAIRCCTSRIPPGFDAAARRRFIDDLAAAEPGRARGVRRSGNRHAHRAVRDGVSRCKRSVPELTDLSKEPARTFELYGPDARKPGTLRRQLPARPAPGRARRALHPALPSRLGSAQRSAQADPGPGQGHRSGHRAALVQDLKERGLLEDTLVVWGGEFGRTVYCQGKLTADNYGRDHHPRCFTMWLAGGGIKPGITLRRDRRLLLQHRRRIRSTCTTCTRRSCTAWASITRG